MSQAREEEDGRSLAAEDVAVLWEKTIQAQELVPTAQVTEVQIRVTN
jgi:hypothetical protein